MVDAGNVGSWGRGMDGEAPAKRNDGSEGTESLGPVVDMDGAIDAVIEDAGLRSAPDSGIAQGTRDAQVSEPQGPAMQQFVLPPVTTPQREILVAPADMATSENGAFTEDGRLFVIGGDKIFEIVGGPDAFDAVVFATGESCIFGGLGARGPRLYATCTNVLALSGELLVYEPTRPQPLVGRAMIESEAPSHFNGMAFGPDGALYVSNYLANNVEDPAVVRLELLEEEPLRFVQTPFVAASSPERAPNTGGGSRPNGIRFAGDVMYLVRGPDVVAVPVTLDDPTAPLDVVYEAEAPSPTIDDFEIVDERMWLTQFSASALLGLPQRGQLVVTDLQGNVQFEMDLPFIPSSTIVSDNDRFGRSILLTDFFEGGLHRVTFAAPESGTR